MQKWPGLESVVRQLYEDHAEARRLDESASFNDVADSFYDGLMMRRRADQAAGIEPTVPEKVSIGWLCDMKRELDITDSAVGSTEIKRVDPATNENHFKEFHRKCREFSIPLTAVMSFDEFNDFRLRGPKRVQIAHTEKGQNAKRRVARTTTSRITMTCGVLFSLLHKGKLLVMLSQCSKEQQKLIERDFGDKVVLVVGHKWMNCKIHHDTMITEMV